jgi:ABC-type multidrug transport system fused ATPase/permease subunit
MLPFLVKYFRKPITLEEIPALREDDSSAATLGAFRADQAYWDARYAAKHGGAKRHRNLGLNLARFFARDIARQSAWACLFICLQYLPPTGLRLLLQYVKNRQVSDQPTHVAFVYVGMMAFGQCAGIMAMAQCLYLGRRVCVRIRAIIIAEVFTKALRRRDVAGAVKKTVGKDGKVVETAGANDGKVANLVSNDAFAVSEVCAYTYYLVSCPFAVIINSVLLFNTLGIASLAGMAVIVLFIPMQALTGRIYAITQRKLMAATDARLETVTEAIAHIKLIKFNAWESKFFDRMGATRKQELQALLRKFAISTVQQVLIWGMPAIVASAAFAVHSVALKQPLTADAAFASLILFNMLRDPLALFQDTFSRLLQAYTSCSRIQEYLEEPDTLKYEQLSKPGPEDPKIGFKGAVLGYHTHDEIKDAEFAPFRLGPLDLSFPVGSLSIIVGSVGSGKTTLVSSLLGETTLLEGKIFMPDDKANRDVCPVDPVTGLADTVAYCSQTPWLVGASIRENITFGSSWDEGRYNAVVDACALRRDFEIFELGDETEVGEKGTTCSGGQKARIALARALYSSAATIILDDVLSAVDAQTARHLYVNCLQGPLMSGRTVILVTHQVSLVAPAASLVVMLDAGNVVAAGTPAELMASGQLEMLEEVDTGASSSTPTLTGSPKDIIEDNFDRTEAETEEMQKKIKADKAAPETQKLAKQLVATESQGQGMIGMDTYMLYFRSMGGIVYWVILWTALIAAQILQVGSNAWIKDWANSFDSARSIRATLQSWTQGHGTTYYLLIYMAISAVYLFSVAARCGWNYLGSLHASRKLWDRLLYRILGAKMRFFDATPSGRIINRLSKDMFSIDNEAGESECCA